jgi:hypothetical protein
MLLLLPVLFELVLLSRKHCSITLLAQEDQSRNDVICADHALWQVPYSTTEVWVLYQDGCYRLVKTVVGGNCQGAELPQGCKGSKTQRKAEHEGKAPQVHREQGWQPLGIACEWRKHQNHTQHQVVQPTQGGS